MAVSLGMKTLLTNILFSRWSSGNFAHRRNWLARVFGVSPNKVRSPKFLSTYDPKDQIEGDIAAIRREVSRAAESMRFSMGCGLRWAIDHTPSDVGINFSAHGIIGGVISGEKKQFPFPVGHSFENGHWNTYVDPLAALGEILKNGINHSRGINQVPFSGGEGFCGAAGAANPYIDGGIILVSSLNKKLDRVQYVVLGAQYNRCFDWLRREFPHTTFIPWHEAPKVLTRAAKSETQSHFSCLELTKNNHPLRDVFYK